MNIAYVLAKALRRLFAATPHDGQQEVLALLRREYVGEIGHAIELQHHSERMRYPQFREKLLSIARDERRHARWLEQRIIALGGEVPRALWAPQEALNSWEDLQLDLNEEKRCTQDLEERLINVERTDPETAGLLSRILKEEKNHSEAITDMLMRSDPQAEWPVSGSP